LPDDTGLTLRLVRHCASVWARESDWYWTVADPVGLGFFGMFLPTAYCAGFLLNFIHGLLAAFRFNDAGDLDRYLGLVADYARLIAQMAERTAGQAERGMRMPKVQVSQARALMSALRQGSRANLSVARERLGALSGEHFQQELEGRLTGPVQSAFDRMSAV